VGVVGPKGDKGNPGLPGKISTVMCVCGHYIFLQNRKKTIN